MISLSRFRCEHEKGDPPKTGRPVSLLSLRWPVWRNAWVGMSCLARRRGAPLRVAILAARPDRYVRFGVPLRGLRRSHHTPAPAARLFLPSRKGIKNSFAIGLVSPPRPPARTERNRQAARSRRQTSHLCCFPVGPDLAPDLVARPSVDTNCRVIHHFSTDLFHIGAV